MAWQQDDDVDIETFESDMLQLLSHDEDVWLFESDILLTDNNVSRYEIFKYFDQSIKPKSFQGESVSGQFLNEKDEAFGQPMFMGSAYELDVTGAEPMPRTSSMFRPWEIASPERNVEVC